MLKLIGLLPLLFLFADETKKKDEDLYQGVWTGVQMIEEGEEAPKEKAAKLSFTFKGNKLEVSGDKEVEKYTFKLDASKKPKWIDFGEEKDLIQGIYELDVETLRICWNKSEKAGRPTEFKPTTKNKWSMAVLKRKDK
jgi:uncharacterized protein (TIGR03067 family)